MFASAASVLAIIGAGTLADKVGQRVMVQWGSIAFALYVFPFFLMVDTGNVVLFTIAVVVAMVVLSAIAGPVAALYSSLFDVHVRYSGASLSFQLASVLGGGLTPLICTFLLGWTGSTWAICAYLIALNILAWVCMHAISRAQPARKTKHPTRALGRPTSAPRRKTTGVREGT